MDKDKPIIVTGAAGFIGSRMAALLNKEGFYNVIIVDDFSRTDKKGNFESLQTSNRIQRDELFNWLSRSGTVAACMFHLGARTDTTEFDYSVHQRLNVDYSKAIWEYCCDKNIPLIYASSAATYGAGELGYKDDHDLAEKLQPLNPYGISKNEFDKWALQQSLYKQPPFWAGLKFFNVYGFNETHKGRMASMIFHGFNQIQKTGKVKLFRSHKEGFKDGEQLRDFIYVKDVVKVCLWLAEHPVPSGLYNLGTGKARTFNDLVKAVFKSMQLEPVIEYIDTPADIRDKYQYFTEADMDKLRNTGYTDKFYSLEEGVKDYVKDLLLQDAGFSKTI